MADVSLHQVSKTFPGDVVAVRDFCLDMPDGQAVVLVGPTGCGKTTTLRLVAGLEEVSSGTIRIDGRVVQDLPPKARDVAMVFQSDALYPHMTVFENLAFPLRLRKVARASAEGRIKETAQTLGITELLARRPAQLSGGQRQRVALGRAMVRQPRVFLFDEPLSNLDAGLRIDLRREIKQLQRRLGRTTLYVTHDQAEAMMMADIVVVMNDGAIQQVADPAAIYHRPANVFVAGFFGTPSMNLLHGRIQRENSGFSLDGRNIKLPLPPQWDDRVADHVDKKAILGVRPEDVQLAQESSEARRLLTTVNAVEPMGPETHLYLNCGEHRLAARVPSHMRFQVGAHVDIGMNLDKAHLFDSVSGQAIS